MTILADYKKNYERQPRAIIVLLALSLLCQWISALISLALHETWYIWFAIAATTFAIPTVTLHGITCLQARRHRPAVWIEDEKLYAVSPLHFRMRMDDIASWQIVRRSRFGFHHSYVALKTRTGKERLIGLGFIADKERFLAWLTHLFGPKTQPAAASATSGALNSRLPGT